MQEYMIQGILESGIIEDGGEQCYNQIDRTAHIALIIAGFTLNLFIYWKWKNFITPKEGRSTKQLKTNGVQIFMAILSTVVLVITAIIKMKNGKGIFMLNPCHVSLVAIIFMCLKTATPFMRKLHTIWSTWLFGAIMAIMLPHIRGISQFQVFLFFLQHLLIAPIGPLVLYRRYGYVFPNFFNQLPAFSFLIFYHCLVLFPLSVLTKVNLNFTLCHSPVDGFHPYYGCLYIFFSQVIFGIISYFCRLLCYIVVCPLKMLVKQQKLEIPHNDESTSKQ